jgi:inward rectifier potassium channel
LRSQLANVERVGLGTHPLRDLYHLFLRMSWSRLIALLVLAYLVINGVFAGLYLLSPTGIENARPGSFIDAFFFSVQTMATIGYGKMTPNGPWTNTLVTVEALFGMLSTAMATGLMFAKFSRATARVLFSKVLLVTVRDGQRALVLRMGNERANQIVEAQLRLVFLRNETTKEGEPIRKMTDLTLQRASTTAFVLSWTAVHVIDDTSPLKGHTPESLRACDAQIIASIIGTDDTFGQQVHANHSYRLDDVVWGGRFVDVIEQTPEGKRRIHFERFHDVIHDVAKS